jgi:hypothetical protein
VSLSRFALGLFVACCVSASPCLAHHGFFLEFDAKLPVTLTGAFRLLEWANPHIFIDLDVKDPKTGKVASWECEGASPNVLYRKGWRKSMFTPGMTLVVRGWRARSGLDRCALAYVQLPDGKVLESNYEASPPDAQ